MKKILLLSTLLLGSFYANAQLSCDAPVVLTTSGTYTVPTITGTNNVSCYSDTVDSSGNPMASNWYSYTAVNTADVIITADGTTITSMQIVTGTCDALECFDVADETITFSAVAGTTYYIVWDSYYSNASFKFDFKINTCSAPTVINEATNVTTTSATLNWDPAAGTPFQYEVEYGPIGFNQGDGTTKTVFSNTANLTGLTPSANYEYYVRSLCGVDSNSEWVGPIDLTLLKVVPYASGFDNNNELAGWGVQGDWNVTYGIGNTAANAQTPDQYIIFNSTTTAAVDNWMFTPAFSLTSGQVISLSFYALTSSETTNKKVKVTIGSAQDKATQTTTIYNNESLNSAGVYTKFTTPNYTVPADGTYVFGFNDYTPMVDAASGMRMDTFSVNLGGGLSVNDFLSNQFDVFPNPANNVISVMNTANIQVSSISITDLNGRIVKKGDFNNVSNIKMNISDLSSGVYMMSIVSDKGTATKKLIKN